MERRTRSIGELLVLIGLLIGWGGLGVMAMLFAMSGDVHWYLALWVIAFAALEIVICLAAVGFAVHEIWRLVRS